MFFMFMFCIKCVCFFFLNKMCVFWIKCVCFEQNVCVLNKMCRVLNKMCVFLLFSHFVWHENNHKLSILQFSFCNYHAPQWLNIGSARWNLEQFIIIYCYILMYHVNFGNICFYIWVTFVFGYKSIMKTLFVDLY